MNYKELYERMDEEFEGRISNTFDDNIKYLLQNSAYNEENIITETHQFRTIDFPKMKRAVQLSCFYGETLDRKMMDDMAGCLANLEVPQKAIWRARMVYKKTKGKTRAHKAFLAMREVSRINTIELKDIWSQYGHKSPGQVLKGVGSNCEYRMNKFVNENPFFKSAKQKEIIAHNMFQFWKNRKHFPKAYTYRICSDMKVAFIAGIYLSNQIHRWNEDLSYTQIIGYYKVKGLTIKRLIQLGFPTQYISDYKGVKEKYERTYLFEL